MNAQLAIDHTATRAKDLPLPPNVCPQPVLAFWGINMPNICLIPNIPHRFLIAPM